MEFFRRISAILFCFMIFGGAGASWGSEKVSAGGSPPGGLYLGYYLEDPATNPEDPTMGAFVLNLPATDGDFSGAMYFTYFGCQSTNIGEVAGKKMGMSLNGTWQGGIDGVPQSGTYTGVYDVTTSTYSGKYLNSRGKQFRDLRPCIQYSIAPNGSWEMFPAATNVPASFKVSMKGSAIFCNPVANAAYMLMYIVDPVIAKGSGNPVIWQAMTPSAFHFVLPSQLPLRPGKEYLAVVVVADAGLKRLAFGSIPFVR